MTAVRRAGATLTLLACACVLSGPLAAHSDGAVTPDFTSSGATLQSMDPNLLRLGSALWSSASDQAKAICGHYQPATREYVECLEVAKRRDAGEEPSQ